MACDAGGNPETHADTAPKAKTGKKTVKARSTAKTPDQASPAARLKQGSAIGLAAVKAITVKGFAIAKKMSVKGFGTVKNVSAKGLSRVKAVYGNRPGALKNAARAVGGWTVAAWTWLKRVGREAYAYCKTYGRLLFWDYPKRGYRRYLAIESENLRRGIAGGAAALLVTILAVSFWPRSGALAPGFEFCEFLARPAAELYIDGELASSEIPPIHRTQLSHGPHTIRFVSPENQEHEVTIQVAGGQPTQWFMSFITNRMSKSALKTEEESK